MVFLIVISGKAPNGGDFWGEQWATENNIPIIPFPADWYNLDVEKVYVKPGTNYNSLAGFNRNLEMAKFAKEHNGRLIAIYKGKSSGTRDMVKCAKTLGLLVYVYEIVS